MAYLAPFGVLAARGVRVCEGEGELGVFLGFCLDGECWCVIDEADLGRFLDFGWIDGVAYFGRGVLPGKGDCQLGGERVQYGRDDFCVL